MKCPKVGVELAIVRSEKNQLPGLIRGYRKGRAHLGQDQGQAFGMHASQRRQCMSIAFRRSVGFVSSLLIGGQASPFMDESKRIRQTRKRRGEFLESRLRWQLLHERRFPEG